MEIATLISGPVLTPATAARLASRAATERVGLFPQAITPLLEDFVVRLGAIIGQLAPSLDLGLDLEELGRQAALDLADELSGLSLRALVADFHLQRAQQGRSFDTASSAAWAEYEATTHADEFTASLFERFPVLGRLVAQSVDFRLRLLHEAVQHLVADQQDLREAGLLPEGSLLRLRVSDGDLHNGGRAVVLADFTEGSIVHKPRSLGCEDLASRLLDLVNPGLRADCSLRVPRLLDRGDHGWQEFVATAPAADLAAAGRFAYRMGAFAVVFAALGTTDLHCGNVLACGEEPMFVDLETITQLRNRIDRAAMVEAGPRMAVLETGLLPFQVSGALVDIDISGIGRADVQESRHQSTSLVDLGTDGVRLGTVPSTLLQSDNLLHLAGRPVAIRDFETDFDAGLQDALAAIRSVSVPLRDAIRASRFQVRQVMRPTMRYARLLQAATHPDYLGQEEERSRLMSRLHPVPGLPQTMASAVHALEVHALERGDVPCFVVDSHSTSLWAPIDGEVPGVFDLTPVEDMLEVLRRFLEVPDQQHRYLALASLSGSVPTVATTERDDAPHPCGLFSDIVAGGATLLPARVTHLLDQLDISPSSNESSWLIPQVTGHGRLGLGAATASLYDGGGIPLLLAHTGAAGSAERALSDNFLKAVAEPAAPLGRSLFSGPAAAAFLLDEMAGVTRGAHWSGRRDALLHQLLSTPAVEGAPADLIGGIAGVAAYLAQPGRSDLVDAHRRLLDEALPELVAVLESGFLPPHETAHGALGVAWSLARLGQALGDEHALDVARARLADSRDHWRGMRADWPHVHDASWCKGHAGALLCIAEGLVLTGDQPTQVLAEVAPLIGLTEQAALGRGRDLTPCHGISGSVQVFVHLSRVLGAPELAVRGARILDERLARVGQIGFNGGLHRSQTSLSYMTGLTGLAHTALIASGAPVGIPLALTTTAPLRDLVPEGEC
ncbi:MAG TPA: type 2 lantipeptide synthetase LanM [Candidatus Luteococcus avicola]|nr:type 2 lantipeptide synthetase LanM [Candidatus Luteococcus avicola]